MKWVQLQFDFDELQEKEKPALPFFKQAKNDNERLLNFQHAYKNGDKGALNKMYLLGYTIALKYIETIGKKNRPVAQMAYSDKEEKAHNAITYIISRYLCIDNFVIQKSFTSYLYLRVQHELFYQRKVDKIVDFVDLDEFYKGK